MKHIKQWFVRHSCVTLLVAVVHIGLLTTCLLQASSAASIAQRLKSSELPALKLVGHSGVVGGVKFSADNTKIVTASHDGTAKIWDARTGALMVNLQRHTDLVSYAEFSPDGQSVVTSSWDTTAKIWDVQTGKMLQNIEPHSGRITCAKFSPDGMIVVTACLDGTASIWDRRTGRMLHTFATGRAAIDDPQAIAHFSPDAKLLLTASSSDAKIWNVQTRQLMHTLVDSQLDNYRGLTDAQFSPDGSNVVIACKDEKARIWNSQTGILIDTIENNRHIISSASFCPDGKKLVVTSLDGIANLWDLQDHSVVKTFTVTKPGIKKVTFSRYENFMATAAWTDNISVWNLQTGNVVHTFTGPARVQPYGEFSPDGTRIATPAEDFCVNLTDINPLIVGDYFSNKRLPLKQQTLLVTLDKLSRENRGGPIIQEDIPEIAHTLRTLPTLVGDALRNVYKVHAVHAPHNILKPGLNRPFNTLYRAEVL